MTATPRTLGGILGDIVGAGMAIFGGIKAEERAEEQAAYARRQAQLQLAALAWRAQWEDYYTRTGELPDSNCAKRGDAAGYCGREYTAFVQGVRGERAGLGTPAVIVMGLLFVVAFVGMR